MPKFMRIRAKYRTGKKRTHNSGSPNHPQQRHAVPSQDHDYKIKEIKVAQAKIPQPVAAEANIIPRHPFRWYVVGASGSGKTNLLINLLTRKDFYKNYFDDTLILSGTPVHLDPAYNKLNLPLKNFYPVNAEVLSTVMDLQETHIEEVGIANARKVLIILDDIIAYPEFARSPELIDLFIKSRKWNISVILLSQAYHRVHKTVRLQATAIVFFKGSNKETEVLTEDFNAPGVSNKEFIGWINYATHEPFNFFFIDLHQPLHTGRRYRKNLDEPIDPHDSRLIQFQPRRHKFKKHVQSKTNDEQGEEQTEVLSTDTAARTSF